jgi:hypothetical protein
MYGMSREVKPAVITANDMARREEMRKIDEKYVRTRDGLHMRPNNLDGIARANLRSAVMDNIRTRPGVTTNTQLTHGGGIPSSTIPLQHVIAPLPTLPYIVGNTTYNPDMANKPMETAGTSFIRSQMQLGRTMKPMMESGVGMPSRNNPTVL